MSQHFSINMKCVATTICFIAAVAAMAGTVDRTAALGTAQRFMPDREFTEGNPVSSRRVCATGTDDKDYFYIFNAKDDGGYVIVSADDRTTPVLGYATSGSLDETDMPANMKAWLDGYRQQIKSLETTSVPIARRVAIGRAAIAPLLTTQWNQYGPYNNMCPDVNYKDYYESGYDALNRCVTGCAATAMAQIMYYWKWPSSCDALEQYERDGHVIKALPATTFKWSSMKDTYEKTETGDAADAVAELMRYCGQAVKMNYAKEGSGGAVSTEVMASVFRYSPNCRVENRDGYSLIGWETTICDELAAHRPVLYSGNSGYAGHEFIIDGYDGNGFFHINWGWGGYKDSYFILSLCDGFQFGQEAVIGLKPAESGEAMVPYVTGYVSYNYPESTYKRNSTSSNFKDVVLKGSVITYYNLPPTRTVRAEIGWGLYKDDVFVQKLSSKSITIPQEMDEWFDNDATVSFGAGLEDGKYQLFQIYRLQGDTGWKRCGYKNSDNNLLAEVKQNTLTVRLFDSSNMAFVVNSLSVSDNAQVNQEVKITANITNTGDAQRIAAGLWVQQPGSTKWKGISIYLCFLDYGHSDDIIMRFTPDVPGTYNVRITASADETALKTTTVNVAGSDTVYIGSVAYLCTPAYRQASIVLNPNADRGEITTVDIQSSITSSSGIECKVTRIQDNAFSAWYNVESLKVPEGIESIGNRVFESMWGLKRLELPSTLKEIGDYQLSEDHNLTEVVSHATQPAPVSDMAFCSYEFNLDSNQYESVLPSATLLVPKGTRQTYMATPGWNQFTDIQEMDDDDDGIEVLMKSQRIMHIFSLDGSRLDKIKKGLNIVILDDGTVRKVMFCE